MTTCIIEVHRKYPDRFCALTTTWAAKELPITIPIRKITAAEN